MPCCWEYSLYNFFGGNLKLCSKILNFYLTVLFFFFLNLPSRNVHPSDGNIYISETAWKFVTRNWVKNYFLSIQRNIGWTLKAVAVLWSKWKYCPWYSDKCTKVSWNTLINVALSLFFKKVCVCLCMCVYVYVCMCVFLCEFISLQGCMNQLKIYEKFACLCSTHTWREEGGSL